jgi:geranylgeranyl diphosphate synthase type II
MEYSLFAGGKRLRPILMLEMCRVVGGDTSEAMPFACAMEMIHTYSLIHDDLPAMDNDDLRRGIPTSHIKFGEAIAILAGDALLNCAFETASSYNGKHPERAMRALNTLSVSSGTEGMIGGQVIDIECEGKAIELDEIRYLHLLKTGAIIRSACTIGAIMGGASEDEIKAADEFALNLGTAFQIRDDILDVIGSEAELGKPIGSDEEQNKNTYVRLLGVEKSEELVKEYSGKAIAALEIFGEKADFLRKLTEYLVGRMK